MVIIIYLFANVGVIVFRDNDPWHWGQLHVALITLFRMSTLEDWTDVMYVSMYGCFEYGYDLPSMGRLCNATAVGPYNATTSFAPGFGVGSTNWALSVIFSLSFVLLSALVMLSLFVGVITTSMESASRKNKKLVADAHSISELRAQYSLTPARISLYEQIFNVFDADGSGSIDHTEFRQLMLCKDRDVSSEELEVWKALVDENNDGDVAFVEFVKAAVLMQYEPDLIAAKRTAIRAAVHAAAGHADVPPMGLPQPCAAAAAAAGRSGTAAGGPGVAGGDAWQRVLTLLSALQEDVSVAVGEAAGRQPRVDQPRVEESSPFFSLRAFAGGVAELTSRVANSRQPTPSGQQQPTTALSASLPLPPVAAVADRSVGPPLPHGAPAFVPAAACAPAAALIGRANAPSAANEATPPTATHAAATAIRSSVDAAAARASQTVPLREVTHFHAALLDDVRSIAEAIHGALDHGPDGLATAAGVRFASRAGLRPPIAANAQSSCSANALSC